MHRLHPSARFCAWGFVLVTVASTAPLAYAAGAASKPPSITRTVYGPTAPQNAPGQSLTLQEVVIPPGTALSEHFHEGTQLATIRSGVLTYNVVSGSVDVTRANGKTENVGGPGVVTLRKGDSIVETQSLVHYGANKGKVPVVIELAALLRAGAPFATAVGQGGAGTTPVHLEAMLSSQSRTLHQVGASAQNSYGWNQLTGNATADGAPVGIELLGSVDYTNGTGPFSGFLTFTYPDGSTLAASMQGSASANPDGSTAFAATLGVIGGTGQYATSTGTGTFTGTRTAALGSDVSATFDLELAH
jgi:hypothetical protein